MAAGKSTPSAQYDKEIDALLNRLHSGCRFVNFEDLSNPGKGSDGVIHDVCNQLRNASSPDETHAELGRALARSYVESLHSISTTLQSSSSDGNVQSAIERGERILQSLCCGEDASESGGESRIHSGKAYASVAYAFFGRLRSFFLSDRNEDDSMKAFIRGQWHNWCIRCEELVLQTADMPLEYCEGIYVLNACLKSYSYICYLGKQGSTGKNDGLVDWGCAGVYESLTHHSSRKYLIRMCVAHAVSLTQSGLANDLVGILSPLFRSCVLAAKRTMNQIHHRHAERQLLLQEILRGCSTLLHRVMAADAHDENDTLLSQIANMVQYLTTTLTSYLNQCIHASFSKVKVTYDGHQHENTQIADVFELGYDWLRGICDLMARLVLIKDNNIAINAVSGSIEKITATVLPQFTPDSFTATFDMTSIYSTLVSCINSLPQKKLLPMANASVALRLGSLSLTLQDDAEMNQMVELIVTVFKCLDDTSDDGSSKMFTGGILTALGCVFRCRPTCFDSATQLNKLGESILQRTPRQKQEHKDESDGVHLMDIITSSTDCENFQSLIDIISVSISDTEPASVPLNFWRRRPLSLSDQCSGLLLGMSLLHISITSPERVKFERALAFIRSFLQCYSRLASRVVPSIIDVARTCLALQSPSTQKLLSSLEFLSSPCIVSDPHGAHLAWAFLSSLVKDGVPTAVRSAVIRLLPEMCSSNKRLFRRARNVIGKSMVAQDPIIRMSATAALSDLANLDLLRDVEQILGWVQNRLTDDEPAVVYYALEVLRYLVVNEDLEFDLVIRVLEKRLDVDISNVDMVLGLDAFALEGLVALMGEGGLEEEDDDDESNNGEEDEPIVSSQSVKAVSLLVELASLPQLLIKDGIGQKDEAFLSSVRIQKKIYGSLAGYSAEVLGLDSESIRAWDGIDSSAEISKDMNSEVKRYLCLKEIVLSGLDFATGLSAKANHVGKIDEAKESGAELLESVTAIGKTLLQFEEDVHGSFLFRGGQFSSHGSSEKSSKGKAESRSHVSKSVLSSLPVASSIQDMFESDPRSSSATAVLYSIGSSQSDPSTLLQAEDVLTQISECFGDIDNEPLVDPAFQAMQICSLVHCMDTVWKSIQGADDSVKEELVDQVVAQTEEWSETYGEKAYVAMAAFVLAADDSSQCWAGMTKIQNTILEGQGNYLFESEDTRLLCLGLVAARLSRNADARVTGLIDILEQSLSEYGRQTCFGALFGLGVIVTHLVRGNIIGTDPSVTWRREQATRIMSLLLSAFNNCLAEENEVVLDLASSIKCGQATDCLSRSCSDLDSLLIQDGSAQKMRAIMIALSHSFPALSSISSDLLKCALLVVDKLPWGSGKSLILYAAYKNAIESGMLEQKDLSEAIATTSSYVQDSISGFGDALLSLASLCRLSSDKVHKDLELVSKTCHKVLQDRDSPVGGDDKLMLILAGCSAIGELPGLASFTPNIHTAVKKNFVADIVKMLDEIALNDAEELKYRDASTIGLGILCAMNSSYYIRKQARGKNVGNKFDSIQAKDGSVMQSILKKVEQEYSLLCAAPSSDDANRVAVVNKLCGMFSMLEPIAMPGNFSRVIELTLNDSLSNEVELKASSIKLLGSQLESRRRIGFDGRGFVDLSTRLARMPSEQLHSLVGSNAVPTMMKSLPNLIYQIPTSTGEEVVTCLWAICRDDLNVSSSSRSMTEFLVGLKSVLVSAIDSKGKPASKETISPALLRTLQKFLVAGFSDLCTDAVPSDQNTTENLWVTYLQCLKLIPSATVAEADGPNCDITHATVFGMATRASLSPKSTRKVESWIARQEIEDISMANIRMLLLSILTIATHARNDKEMGESILGLFEVMLVKGIDTMSLYVMAAKIAFWWDSRNVYQLHHVDMPIQRVSKMSSFVVTRNLNFNVHNLTPELLIKLFDSFIADLPSKLAVLCGLWKISDEVSNRASRILSASLQKNKNGNNFENNQKMLLSCVRDIVQSIDGGEI